MCVCICISAFICSECCVHFRTGVLSTSACAVVCVVQMFLWHQRKHLRHIRCRLRTYVYMHICVYMHAYVHECVCVSDALRRHCWDLLSVNRSACTCMDICVCMMRVHVHVHMYVYSYICVCIYACIYMCMHTRVDVHMHSCIKLAIRAWQSWWSELHKL